MHTIFQNTGNIIEFVYKNKCYRVVITGKNNGLIKRIYPENTDIDKFLLDGDIISPLTDIEEININDCTYTFVHHF